MTQDDPESIASQIGGYVLAGGRSSRMGQDKALLQLAGRPLIAHAAAKLRRLCAEVRILAGEEPASGPETVRASALAAHAPLVHDLRPNCGPIAGIEAALAHSPHLWNLILPVDMPFLPAAFLESWTRSVVGKGSARAAIFEVAGIPRAMPLMIHREALPSISAAIARCDFALIAAIARAAPESTGDLFLLATTPEQEPWFANLNTAEDLAEAGHHLDALDPP